MNLQAVHYQLMRNNPDKNFVLIYSIHPKAFTFIINHPNSNTACWLDQRFKFKIETQII